MAARPHTLGPTLAFESPAADDGDLTPLSVLVVPAEAELSLRPLWWVGSLAAEAGDAVGLEIVARATRVDGSTLSWTLIGPQRLGRRRADGRYAEVFEAEGTGSVRARHLESIDFFVAEREDGALRGGAAAVAEAPEAGDADPATLERLERAAGLGDLELALRLRVQHGVSAGPGVELRRLILVEGEPDRDQGATASDRQRAAAARALATARVDGGSAVADEAGAPMLRVSALGILVRVEVPDRTAPPEKKRKRGPHDRDDDRLRTAPGRVLAAF